MHALPSLVTDCIASPFYEYVDVLKQYCDMIVSIYFLHCKLYCMFTLVVLVSVILFRLLCVYCQCVVMCPPGKEEKL